MPGLPRVPAANSIKLNEIEIGRFIQAIENYQEFSAFLSYEDNKTSILFKKNCVFLHENFNLDWEKRCFYTKTSILLKENEVFT